MSFKATKALTLWTLLVVAACAAPGRAGIEAQEVWARPAPAMGEAQSGGMAGGAGLEGTGAVFMRLVNRGNEADRLVGAKTDVAQVVEIHESTMQGDVMTMHKLPAGLELPANGQVDLKPGGYHLMLIGLQGDLKAGDRFTVELQFEKSGPLTVEAEVREP